MADSEAIGSPPSGTNRKGLSTVAGQAAADGPVVAGKPGNAGGAKGTGHPALTEKQLPVQEDSKDEARPKPFAISKKVVWEAYGRVKANKGAAGVDEQSMAEFEEDLNGNLYKLWNRMSSGSYFPPPVRAVEIPKKDGGVRVLGVPTVADRIAQTVIGLHTSAGSEANFTKKTVPKFSLYSQLRAVLEERRIEVAESHELADARRNEMKGFTARAGALGHVTLSAPAGEHDDFVSASALACWEWPNQPVAIPPGGYVEFGVGRRESPWGGAPSWNPGSGGRFGGSWK